MTDSQLILKYIQGDSRAFGMLYQRYQVKLRYYLIGRGIPRGWVEDLGQITNA